MKYNFKTNQCPWRDTPKSICDFRIIDELASSKRCVVYAGCFQNHLCVIKKYNKYLLDTDTMRALISEIDIHASLDHIHIVPLYCVVEDQISIALVMELCEMDLYEYNRTHGPFAEDKAVRDVIVPMLQACSYMHKKGIVHTDIKPENILMSKQGVWKLGDFGLAIDTRKSKLTHIQGTQLYIPPEIITDTIHEGEEPKIDTWAIGVLANELIANEIPVLNEDTNVKVRRFNSMIDPHISADAKEFITRATSMDASKRPSCYELSLSSWVQQHKPSKKNILMWLISKNMRNQR